MKYTFKKNHFVYVSLIILLLIIFLNIFVHPSLSIKTVSNVLPKERWVLEKGTNGQLVSSLIDYEKGHIVQYDLNQFERGEHISLKFLFETGKKIFFNKGDSILQILSSDVEERLSEIEGEFETAKANLIAQTTGQKEALINEIKNKINYTDERINQQNILFRRAQTLLDKDLISLQEYETQKWILDLLRIEKKIYEAQLENLKTGAKPEEIDLIKTQIGSLQKRLEVLNKRKNSLLITSPISGYLSDVYARDTLLSVINKDEIILYTPIKVTDLIYFKPGAVINVYSPNIDRTYNGVVIKTAQEAQLLNNQQVIIISIKLKNDNKLLPGMIIETIINIKKISFWEYILKLITS